MPTHLDLFSGIGGFALAGRMAWGDAHAAVAFVERDRYCQAILAKHWPSVPQHDDICTFDARPFLGHVDIVTGGYPCQPFSTAGQRRGTEDDRALWPEMRRIVDECRPRFVVGENVAGHVSLGLDETLADLEALGYACRALVIPAVAVGAVHRRDRVWIVAADTNGTGRQQQPRFKVASRPGLASRPACGDAANAHGGRMEIGRGSANAGADVPGLGDLSGALRQGVRLQEGEARPLPLAHPKGGRLGEINLPTSPGRHDLADPAWGLFPDWAGGEWRAPAPVSTLRDLDDGVSSGVAGWRRAARTRRSQLQALGNAIVPEVAAEIFHALAPLILEHA